MQIPSFTRGIGTLIFSFFVFYQLFKTSLCKSDCVIPSRRPRFLCRIKPKCYYHYDYKFLIGGQASITKELTKVVKSQKRSIDIVSEAIYIHLLGTKKNTISRNEKPPFFVFVGDTSNGKSKLTRALGKLLFEINSNMHFWDGNYKNFLHISASQFPDDHYSYKNWLGFWRDVKSTLYVEDMIISQIKKNPYSIIVFEFNSEKVVENEVLFKSFRKFIHNDIPDVIDTSKSIFIFQTNLWGYKRSECTKRMFEESTNDILETLNFRLPGLNLLDGANVIGVPFCSFDRDSSRDVINQIWKEKACEEFGGNEKYIKLDEEVKDYIAEKIGLMEGKIKVLGNRNGRAIKAEMKKCFGKVSKRIKSLLLGRYKVLLKISKIQRQCIAVSNGLMNNQINFKRNEF